MVVGSGPNGLAAACLLARAGRSVLVLEAAATPGGGCQTAALTLPGFRHDVCSAVHPLAVASPCFRELDLSRRGLTWVRPPVALAHPLDGGRAVALLPDAAATAAALGRDGEAWLRLVGRTAADWERLAPTVLWPPRLPPHPLAAARFGAVALLPASLAARALLRTPEARALFAGLCAHSLLPLSRPASAAFGLVLGALAHVTGWPLPRGGAGRIADALLADLRAHGGELEAERRVDSPRDLPPARVVLWDVGARELLRIAGGSLPGRYRRGLARLRPGPGACKLDWALAGPIPWLAEACRRAGTVHLGGGLEEVEAAERAPWRGRAAERPFVILAQPSLFDPARAPAGRHTAWAYCHVPTGSPADLTAAIEAQVERFAPGFGALILARSLRTAVDLERENPNYAGGDINGGAQDLRGMLARPVLSPRPHRVPVPGWYLCSSATPPGGGVHGMGGWHAARDALGRELA